MPIWKKALGILLLGVLAFQLAACAPRVQAADLMAGLGAKPVEGKEADANFIGSAADFALELFKKTVDKEENSLVSPLSVLLALAMTANGADTQTLAEMEEVLGGHIPLAELNEYLYSYVKTLPSAKKAKLTIANSIWFRDEAARLTVERDFLQRNADYYGAAAYKSPFDKQTLADINNWVKKNTDGMIDSILEEIAEDAVMYLINAIVFEAEWERIYTEYDIREGFFTALDGSQQKVEFMHSEESAYLDDGRAIGFIKPYAGNLYSFAALLPNEGVDLGDYIAGLSGNGFLETIAGAQSTPVAAALPKFSYDYRIKMNEALKIMGMPRAFSSREADFSKLGQSSRGNIFIGEVLHKTFIQVDERGTKAGAVTKVEMKDEAYIETKSVVLDRPFVFAIIDNASNLPLFIGALAEIGD